LAGRHGNAGRGYGHSTPLGTTDTIRSQTLKNQMFLLQRNYSVRNCNV
jgi:hypothetical protein